MSGKLWNSGLWHVTAFEDGFRCRIHPMICLPKSHRRKLAARHGMVIVTSGQMAWAAFLRTSSSCSGLSANLEDLREAH